MNDRKLSSIKFFTNQSIFFHHNCSCFCFQVIITCYEIFSDGASVGGSLDGWSTWARVLKELSHVLLVSYSALNPLAYCGELLLRAGRKAFRRIGQTSRDFLSCMGCQLKTNSNSRFCQSEFEMMKSVGITLNGADPIPQQLQELDAQSRILSGLPPNPPAPGSCNAYCGVISTKHSTSSISTTSSFGILKKSTTIKSGSTSNSSSLHEPSRKNYSSGTTQIQLLEKCDQQAKV